MIPADELIVDKTLRVFPSKDDLSSNGEEEKDGR